MTPRTRLKDAETMAEELCIRAEEIINNGDDDIEAWQSVTNMFSDALRTYGAEMRRQGLELAVEMVRSCYHEDVEKQDAQTDLDVAIDKLQALIAKEKT